MESPEENTGANQLRVPSVQLRVVDESLGILKEFSSKLELTCTADGRVCRVCFHDKLSTSTRVCILSRLRVITNGERVHTSGKRITAWLL